MLEKAHKIEPSDIDTILKLSEIYLRESNTF